MRTLHKTDIVKVDFGVEVNGWIIDSTFTVYFDEANESFTNLTNGVREATYTVKLVLDVNIYYIRLTT